MHDHDLFHVLQVTIADIRLQIKLAVSLVIPDGHINPPLGFVWVCIKVAIFTLSPFRVDESLYCKDGL